MLRVAVYLQSSFFHRFFHKISPFDFGYYSFVVSKYANKSQKIHGAVLQFVHARKQFVHKHSLFPERHAIIPSGYHSSKQ